MELTPEAVGAIHETGGTILGSSRGSQDINDMVDTLTRLNIGILFAIGGEGTLRGAQAIAQEIARHGLKIGVIGIPKTIDNDISFSFSKLSASTPPAPKPGKPLTRPTVSPQGPEMASDW